MIPYRMEASARPLRIGLLIRALTIGGAERQLVSIARGLRGIGHDVEIMVYYRANTHLESEAEAAGVPVTSLDKLGRWDIFGFLRRLHSCATERSLDVVYSFLPTSNVLASVLWGWGGAPVVVWSVRGGNAVQSSRNWLDNVLTRLERHLARRPAEIIVNSEAGRDARCASGWPPDRMHVIRNGIDAGAFAFDPLHRLTLRAEWAVAPSTRVIGFAGRLDPVKGLEIFLHAIREIVDHEGNVRIVIAGAGPAQYTASLQTLSNALGLDSRVHWLGQLESMSGFYSAIDLLCLPSLSEGCSNVIAEALACCTLVVATRSGDTGALIDDRRLLAAPGNVHELVRALRDGLHMASTLDGAQLRAAILDRLSSENMVRATENVLAAAVRAAQLRAAS